MRRWSKNKFCYYPTGSRFADYPRFISKKLSKELGFKVILGLTLCMKGGHTHNHIYNVCNRITFRGKKSRRVKPADKKYFVSIFWEKIAMMPDELNKIIANKRKR